MTLLKLTPNLMVEDVRKTIDYYQSVLGFETNAAVPEGSGPLDWASMRNGSVEMMFQSTASLTSELPVLRDKPISATLSFYIEIEGLQSLYDSVKTRATIVQDLHTTFYDMREFAIQDCNGYILAFAEKV